MPALLSQQRAAGRDRRAERTAGLQRDDTAAAKLDKLGRHLAALGSSGSSLLPLLAELLSIPTGERGAALRLSPERRKTRTLAALTARIEALATRDPLLVVFEDVHWIDPTSGSSSSASPTARPRSASWW